MLDSRPKWAKSISVFRPKRHKNHTLLGRHVPIWLIWVPPALVKNFLEGGGSMSPFQPLVCIRELGWINRLCESRKASMRRFMRRKREFFGVIWRCFARAKCGNIASSFRKCCDCRGSHLLCDLPKALTYKTQVCGWARVTRILCAKHKNTSWVFS